MEQNELTLEIKEFLSKKIEKRAEKIGVDLGTVALGEEDSFFTNGIYDSVNLLDLISDIEEKFEIEIDFFEMDMNKLTTQKGLIEVISSLKNEA